MLPSADRRREPLDSAFRKRRAVPRERASGIFRHVNQLSVLVLLAACFALTAFRPAAAVEPFYSVAGIDLSAYPPGALIRTQAMPGAPDGAAAFRVLYASRGLHDEPIAVSGVVIVPNGPPPPGGRPVVAWAHPTSGIEDQCAPSLAFVFFESVQGLAALLAKGYVVAATDYPGLGTAGVHPYLVGVSEASAVIDSVRVAHRIAGVGDGDRYAVWGHSQGGQAALFTGLITQTYAPELRLIGVAAAAPATELATLLTDDIDTSGGRNITAMTLWSWSRVFDAPLTRIVAPEAIPIIDALAGDCIERAFDLFERIGPTRALARRFLVVDDFAAAEPWRTLLAQNAPGVLPRETPVFIAQGENDALVLPKVTLAYRDRLCEAGVRVDYRLMPYVTHAFAGRDAAPAAVAWLSDRFAGVAAAGDCGN